MKAFKTKVKTFLEDIYKYYGYDLRGYEIDFSLRAVNKEMGQHSIKDFNLFAKETLRDHNKLHNFMDRFLISVTDMFRDLSPFEIIRGEIIEHLRSYPQIKIWSCGCSSGKEVLSLAIILQEAGLYERSILYATDINQKVIKLAKTARYPLDELPRMIENYYLSGGKEHFSKYYIIDEKKREVCFDSALLKNVYFGVHNLVTDKVFNEFELILCRNVLIYFNKELREKSLQLFCSSLVHGGYLVLGDSENINDKGFSSALREVADGSKIWKNIKR